MLSNYSISIEQTFQHVFIENVISVFIFVLNSIISLNAFNRIKLWTDMNVRLEFGNKSIVDYSEK